MTTIIGKHLVSKLSAIVMGAALVPVAGAAVPPSNSIVVAVRRGDCLAAVRLLNPEVRSNDMQTAFLAGRLLDEAFAFNRTRSRQRIISRTRRNSARETQRSISPPR